MIKIKKINPLYLEETSQGWKIVKIYVDLNPSCLGDIHVIVEKKGIAPYSWGWCYNLETGSWGQGHYDYETIDDALDSMLELHPHIREVQAVKNSGVIEFLGEVNKLLK